MAIGVSVLDSDIVIDSGQTDFDTISSITPASNALILLDVFGDSVDGGSNDPPDTVTGCGLTWVLVAQAVGETDYDSISTWRALGASPSSGTLAISFPNGMEGIRYCVKEYTGTDTSGTNGSGAIVQTKTSSSNYATSLTITMDSVFGSADNMCHAAFCRSEYQSPEAQTPGSGFTEDYDDGYDYGSWSALMHSIHKINDNGPSSSTSSYWSIGGIAIEVKAAPSATTVEPLKGLLHLKGYVTSVEHVSTKHPVAGKYIYKGYVPSAQSAATEVAPLKGLVTFKGNIPFVDYPSTKQPSTNKIIYKGYVPSIEHISTKRPVVGKYVYKGYVPDYVAIRTSNVSPIVGVFAFIGYQPEPAVPGEANPLGGLFHFLGRVPTITGYSWSAIAASTETWSAIAASTETWSAIAASTETWSAVGASSESWSLVNASSNTWSAI